jgi:hypothetical protein
MAKASTDVQRKLVAFDKETWHSLDLLARDSMKSFQELAEEAFRDVLQKYGRPADLKAALRQSARSASSASTPPPPRTRRKPVRGRSR